MAAEQHFSDIPPGHTVIGGHLVALPEARRQQYAQASRSDLAREIARSQVVSGTNTISVRHFGDLGEDSVQHWDDERRRITLPPDQADLQRRASADTARSIAAGHQLSGSSTVTGRRPEDPNNEYDRRFDRRVDGRFAITYVRKGPDTGPIDWSDDRGT